MGSGLSCESIFMAGSKLIQSKIRSTNKTRKVTKAMESTSAAKMRKAQNRTLSARGYARAAVSVLARVAGSGGMDNHPLAQSRTINRVLYIVITSDKGLAGALNSGVLRAVSAHIEQSGVLNEHISIVAVGRKANDYFSRRGFLVEAFHQHKEDVVSRELVREITNEAANRFTMSECDAVYLAYQHFVTTFEQRPTLRTVFPLSLEELNSATLDVSARGTLAKKDTAHEEGNISYEVEPSEEKVLNEILPRLAAIFVYHAMLESQASEHSARMVAMKSASDKGAELSHALTLKYNKARQAAITREVSEVTGGMEAMAN